MRHEVCSFTPPFLFLFSQFFFPFRLPYGSEVLGAQVLEVTLCGVGTVRCLERDAWSADQDSKQRMDATCPLRLDFVVVSVQVHRTSFWINDTRFVDTAWQGMRF